MSIEKQTCHYTDFTSTKDILNSSELWFIDVNNQDDKSERRFLFEFLEKYCPAFYKDFFNFFSAFARQKTNCRAFIFCSSRHDRPQDVRYGNLVLGRYFGGKDWCGLVFNLVKLSERIKEKLRSEHRYFVGNMYYLDPADEKIVDAKDFSNLIVKILIYFFDHDEPGNFKKIILNDFEGNGLLITQEELKIKISEFVSITSKEELEVLIKKNQQAVINIMTCISLAEDCTKHTGFSDEKEKRICIMIHKNEYNIIDTSGTKPRLRIEMDFRDILTDIIITPGQNQSKAIDEIQYILDQQALGGCINIIPCNINWEPK